MADVRFGTIASYLVIFSRSSGLYRFRFMSQCCLVRGRSIHEAKVQYVAISGFQEHQVPTRCLLLLETTVEGYLLGCGEWKGRGGECALTITVQGNRAGRQSSGLGSWCFAA